ncbi:uncharacterized protein At5g01610 [Cucumis sativus]|uniref:Uncharacterized protein n=1 Tax=Cucumis sativus TaxID=3659 RepID=A0A0A0LVK4_CUCSA|nr:uncharacterized protein At5g01610 [Cucumis sativus]KGN64026.1 hypothetical protein Csa_013853 [Cucumis sativus]
MEKTMAKVGSFWISKKAKQEITTITAQLSSFSNTIEDKAKMVLDKIKGKPQKSLPELLREHNLPAGLFPKNIICYELDESKGKLVVHLASACEVSFKDSSIVRYATRVKAKLAKGKLSSVEGMKTKIVVWTKVTTVSVESYKSEKVWFVAGIKKSRPKDAYEMPRQALGVDDF